MIYIYLKKVKIPFLLKHMTTKTKDDIKIIFYLLEYLDVWWDGVYNSDHRVLCPLQREQDAGVGDSRVNHQVIYIQICIVYTKNILEMDSGYIQQIYWFQLFLQRFH